MNTAYRHELKFIISTLLGQELQRTLSGLMAHDRHADAKGGYNIRSLYFDDLYRSAYREKVDGIEVRRKYRIRIYNYSDDVIALECKHKNGAYIHKEDLRLSREEYEKMRSCDYDFLLSEKTPLAQEFFIDARSRLLRPAVIVDYHREPFVYDVGTVRITFDRNIQAIAPQENIFSPDAPGFAVLPPDHLVLEIKFTGKLPEKIRRIFKSYALTQCSASKYCLCADRLEYVLKH